jgi:hypothetical protein
MLSRYPPVPLFDHELLIGKLGRVPLSPLSAPQMDSPSGLICQPSRLSPGEFDQWHLYRFGKTALAAFPNPSRFLQRKTLQGQAQEQGRANEASRPSLSLIASRQLQD